MVSAARVGNEKRFAALRASTKNAKCIDHRVAVLGDLNVHVADVREKNGICKRNKNVVH